MIVFTPNTVIKSADINLNFADYTAKGFVTPDSSWHYVGGAGEPAFQNSWVNYNVTDWGAARFRLDANGYVHLMGLVKNGSSANVIFNLPIGYRPISGTHGMCVSDASNTGTYHVYANGDVRHRTGGTGFFSLDFINFKAEQ